MRTRHHVLYSKARMLRACWTTRTGDGNELFKDEASVAMINKDETSMWVCSSRTG